MKSVDQADRDSYRLIITRRTGSEILFSFNRLGWSLPHLEILPGFRVTEQLTAKIHSETGLRAYCLFFLNTSASNRNSGRTRYAVMEALKHNDRAPTGNHWLPFNGAILPFGDIPEDGAAITEALQEMNQYLDKSKVGPFARPGWLRELFEWVQNQIGPLGLRVTGAIRQLNASSTFSLIRLETTGPAIWFKATGEPNLHELSISLSLHSLFPGYVPSILGVHSIWNGWLSEEALGAPLNDVAESSLWVRAAEELAEFQIASIGKGAALLESRCKDLRLPKLLELIDPFIARMVEFMAAQEKRSPQPLSNSNLALLGQRLKEACALVQEFPLPDTLGHIDLNPGNIIVSPTRCCFLDWAEGCVSHPFITFEYLREHARRSFRQDEGLRERIAVAYLRPWQSFFSPDALTQGMAFSPLIAVFVSAIAGKTWRSLDPVQNPKVAGYFRSLTRRMYREATEIVERSERCLN
jgi:hypothetical protein